MKFYYAKKSQRFLIYLIDFLLISFVGQYLAAGVEALFSFDNSGMNNYLQSAYMELVAVMSGKSNSYEMFELYVSKYFQYFFIDFAFKLVVDLVLVVLLLVVLPKFMGGKTLGRKATNCKLVDKNGQDASIKRLAVREILGTFLCYCFLGQFFGIAGLISLILVLATSRSLPDIISGTYMVIDNPVNNQQPIKEELKENEIKPDYTEVEQEEKVHEEPQEDSQDKYSIDEDDYKIE